MQVTPDELLSEAAQMALELRLKDRVIAALEAENARLRAEVAELTAQCHPAVHGPDAALDSTPVEEA